MKKQDELINIIKDTMKSFDINKIFWNSKLGKVIVFTNPKNGVDGMYLFERNLERYRLFTPNEDFDLYDKIVNDENLIYSK